MITDIRPSVDELMQRDTFQGMSDDDFKRVLNRTLTIAMAKRAKREAARQLDELNAQTRANQRSANLNQIRVNKRIEEYYRKRKEKLIAEMEMIRSGKTRED